MTNPLDDLAAELHSRARHAMDEVKHDPATGQFTGAGGGPTTEHHRKSVTHHLKMASQMSAKGQHGRAALYEQAARYHSKASFGDIDANTASSFEDKHGLRKLGD
jgi:hypothetical protein